MEVEKQQLLAFELYNEIAYNFLALDLMIKAKHIKKWFFLKHPQEKKIALCPYEALDSSHKEQRKPQPKSKIVGAVGFKDLYCS